MTTDEEEEEEEAPVVLVGVAFCVVHPASASPVMMLPMMRRCDLRMNVRIRSFVEDLNSKLAAPSRDDSNFLFHGG